MTLAVPTSAWRIGVGLLHWYGLSHDAIAGGGIDGGDDRPIQLGRRVDDEIR
jgi:hypothetical protein